MSMSNPPPRSLRWLIIGILVALVIMSLCGCGPDRDAERRARFAAQVAADIDAQASAVDQGADQEQGLRNIRLLASALAGAFGYRIDPQARPVYVPAVETQP